jgi:deazaflavin-dependent oxidoreductase (nitroreductase family)
MTELNHQVVAEFRANGGVVVDAMSGHFKNIHLLLLHHTGRRSGRRYVTPLLYVEDRDRYVLVGSNGGAEKEPAWVANVAAMPQVVIEVGARTLTAKPTILREGPAWDRLHATAVTYWPDILEYQTHTTRMFPLIVLDPVADPAARGERARGERVAS